MRCLRLFRTSGEARCSVGRLREDPWDRGLLPNRAIAFRLGGKDFRRLRGRLNDVHGMRTIEGLSYEAMSEAYCLSVETFWIENWNVSLVIRMEA